MLEQAKAKPDMIAILDTCAGDFEPESFKQKMVPVLKEWIDEIRKSEPHLPLLYYSKGTFPAHWRALEDLAIQGIGVDWNTPIEEVLNEFSDTWAIQGNIDPNWLFQETDQFISNIRNVFEKVLKFPASKRKGWVCGLGHGVKPKTPVQNVRRFVEIEREMFGQE